MSLYHTDRLFSFQLFVIRQVLRLQNPEDFHVHLLNNLVLLAKKQKNDAEFVLSDLMKYLSNERYVC